MHLFNKLFIGGMLCLLSLLLAAQTNISGVINTYTPVTAIDVCNNAITVSNTTGFSVGDRAMIIQMKGATVDLTNTAAFGAVTAMNGAGNYEMATIAAINGNDIIPATILTRTYDPAAAVQLVRVPQYTNATITANLTATPWNGSIGGVLAFEATGTVTMNADINVNYQGYRGAQLVNYAPSWNCGNPDFYYPAPPTNAAYKGEGMALLANAFQCGRGSPANAGGGGNGWNHGGGGGANGGNGGVAGIDWCVHSGNSTVYYETQGGDAITYSNADNKIFPGGGGGAGEENNSNGSRGGNGGGLVIIRATTLAGNGRSIFTNGEAAPAASNDGAGGGGAGGTVLLDVANYTGTVTIQANGGNGGNNLPSGHPGSGGGGGGGHLWVAGGALPGAITYQTNGGAGGQYNGNSNGTTPGLAGTSLTGLSVPEGTIPFLLTPPPITATSPLCAGDTLYLTAPTVPGGTYSWTGPNGYASSIQNPIIANADVANAGTYTLIITVAGCPSQPADTLVTINPIPATPILANNGPLCAGATANLTTPAVPNATYNWAGPNGFSSAQQNPVLNLVTVADSGAYDLTISVNGCTSDTGTTVLTVNAVPASPNATNNSPACEGDEVVLSADTVLAASYNWVGPNGFSSNLNSPLIDSAVLADTGYYSVIITDVNGCVSETDSTWVQVYGIPERPAASNNSPLCEGNTLELYGGGDSNATYNWTGPNGFTSSNQNPVIPNVNIATDTGRYFVSITINGCTSPRRRTIVLQDEVAPPAAGTNSPLCIGDDLQLNAAAAPNAQFFWTGPNGFTSSLAQPLLMDATTSLNGTYSVYVELDGCVSNTVDINVEVNALPEVEIKGRQFICPDEEDTVMLSGGDFVHYRWFNGATSPAIIVWDTGSYSLVATDVNGCSNNATITLVEVCPPQVHVPNAFSPNNDGVNDVFEVYYKNIEFFQLQVFDRWGTLLYTTEDPNAQWDGTYKGKKLLPGVYVYAVFYGGRHPELNSVSERLSGSIVLIK